MLVSKYTVHATWDDAPHLTPEKKKEIWDGLSPVYRSAAAKGIPRLDAGAIYPIDEDVILIADFELPVYWPRVYGMDVGWNKTAGLWGAIDRDVDVLYLYSEYYQGEEKPVVHASAFKSRGDWIPGAIDPASRGRSQEDGKRLIDEYRGLGLKLTEADHAVEAGLFAVLNRMSTGGIKVFRSLQYFFEEFRMYRRDEKGKVVKERDHLMDCLRYLVMSGLAIARTMPLEQARPRLPHERKEYDPLREGW
jgi:hypothetical protein